MDDARTIWSLWQSLLESFQPCFRRGGWVRFAQWVTSMVLCDEQYTITQSLTSCALEDRWRVIEHLAEYGSWDRPVVERQLQRLVAAEAPQTLAGYRVMALDDTKASSERRRVGNLHVSRIDRTQPQSGRNGAGPQLGCARQPHAGPALGLHALGLAIEFPQTYLTGLTPTRQ